MLNYPFGWAVDLCRWWDSTGDFCRFCVIVNRAWHQLVLHRNPTFIGMNMPVETDVRQN